jgi:hypothetical protein
MTDSPGAGQAGCHDRSAVLLLTPSRQKIDKEALMRKLFGVTLALVALVLVSPASSWAQKGPIKVGLILPETGPLAANGKDIDNGMQLFFTVIFTVPGVSQFWTYKPEDLLKNPVYSRDYPPCTRC